MREGPLPPGVSVRRRGEGAPALLRGRSRRRLRRRRGVVIVGCWSRRRPVRQESGGLARTLLACEAGGGASLRQGAGGQARVAARAAKLRGRQGRRVRVRDTTQAGARNQAATRENELWSGDTV